MEYNLVTQIDYDVNKQQKDLFNQILDRASTLLNIDKNYIFSIILVDDEQIHVINRDYRNIDRPTDVITFALLDSDETLENEEEELGDVFINMDAVKRQAEEYGHSFEREFCFLFTHGLLHLLGYDHMEKEDEIEMFSLQDEILDEIIKR